MNLLLKLRQLQFPKEFRIYPDQTNEKLNSELTQLNESLKELLKSSSNRQTGDNKEIDKLLADISTGLWRLKSKIVDPKTKEPLNEMNRAYRHLSSVLTAMEEFGIEILDHDGEIFDAGKSIKVLAFEPAKGVEREIVIETVKPSILKNKSCIQMGEVIVGTPFK
jgi:hypothetical protein